MEYLLAFGGGLVIYLVTYLVLKDRANSLPGGAIAMGVALSPWYVTVPIALVGHLTGLLLLKRIRNSNKPA